MSIIRQPSLVSRNRFRQKFDYGPFFSGTRDIQRFHCSHTKKLEPPNEELFQSGLDDLNKLRELVNIPLIVTSGWRSLEHPIEAKKGPKGIHAHYHCAFDIACDTHDAYILLTNIFMMKDWKGVGVAQRGSKRFIHIDKAPARKNPNVWSY